MPIKEILTEIERENAVSYPPSFLNLHEEFTEIIGSAEFAIFMPNSELIDSAVLFREARTKGLPEQYLPFLIEKHTNHTDYYVFDAALTPSDQVGVFACDGLVFSWTSFDSFLTWLRLKTKTHSK